MSPMWKCATCGRYNEDCECAADLEEKNAALRERVRALREALEAIAWHGLSAIEAVERSRRALASDDARASTRGT